MDFESLVRDTNLLLKDVHLYGLPCDVIDENNDVDNGRDGIDVLNVDGGDHILSEKWANIMKDAWEREGKVVEESGDCNETMSLRANVIRLRNMQMRVKECQERMNELSSLYSSVTSRTCSLHDACERALKNQTHLASMAEQIKANLHYFKQADVIFKKLSSGNKLLVTGQSFTSLLVSIDECLHFLRSHSEWKETDVYIGKYEQCLSRAMTCIRGSVLNDLENACNDVRRKKMELSSEVGEGNIVSDEDTLTLLYGVFASRAESVKNALSVAESRFSGVAEFEAMRSECHQVYFSTRQQLVYPVLEATLHQLATTHKDSSCTLARSSSLFILRVIDDEYRIYHQFFSIDDSSSFDSISSIHGSPPPPSTPSSFFWSATSSFDDFVQGITRLLYNMLRPMVIHNPHLETLTELCAILKIEMIEQRCSLMTTMISNGYESVNGRSIMNSHSNHNQMNIHPRGGFVRVINELVGDIVERIVHRVEMYSQSDIANYRPSPGDIAYPEKLEMMKCIEEGEKKSIGMESELDSSSSSSPVDLHCLWYPTVRRTVMCLAKLFKYLDMGVFQSIARDLLTACCLSLENASTAISSTPKKKDGWPRWLDGHLFIIKHLLILREQTAPYRHAAQRCDASLPTKDLSIDFSKMRNSASNLLSDRSRWFEMSTNNAFLELLFQLPIQVYEPTGDSRRVIDSRLRIRCNELVSLSIDLLVKELNGFMEMAENETKKEGFVYDKVPCISPKEIQNISGSSFKTLTTYWPMIQKALSLYIGVSDTQSILLSPIRLAINTSWNRIHTFVSTYLDKESESIAALPPLSHINLITRG